MKVSIQLMAVINGVSWRREMAYVSEMKKRRLGCSREMLALKQ
jgi:hypothetical protein